MSGALCGKLETRRLGLTTTPGSDVLAWESVPGEVVVKGPGRSAAFSEQKTNILILEVPDLTGSANQSAIWHRKAIISFELSLKKEPQEGIG
jgi:hypothetical protein